jgi:excisionase family DNA binding protein
VTEIESELWTVDQVADYLQLSRETIRRWIRAGKLHAIKLGSNRAGLRIPETEVVRLRDQGQAPASKR